MGLFSFTQEIAMDLGTPYRKDDCRGGKGEVDA